MAYENKPFTFMMFRNNDKSSERAPDWKGRFVNGDGEEMWISGWDKSGTNSRGDWEGISGQCQVMESDSGQDQGSYRRKPTDNGPSF
jgi:formylmethanofuran dehydrogenase subunit C